jgi:SnoaL-like polyketide cyclase
VTARDRVHVLAEHLAAENAHDLDAIMATYVEHPMIVLNGNTIAGRERVRTFHERFGFGGGAGSFDDVHVAERCRHVTADAIVIEQTLSGRHVGEWHGLAPTGRRFETIACTVYRFAPDGLLASEDVYLDIVRIRQLLVAT